MNNEVINQETNYVYDAESGEYLMNQCGGNEINKLDMAYQHFTLGALYDAHQYGYIIVLCGDNQQILDITPEE